MRAKVKNSLPKRQLLKKKPKRRLKKKNKNPRRILKTSERKKSNNCGFFQTIFNYQIFLILVAMLLAA